MKRLGLLLALLLTGCVPTEDGMLLCSLRGEAFYLEQRLSWVVRRIPVADKLCPKPNDQQPPKSIRMKEKT